MFFENPIDLGYIEKNLKNFQLITKTTNYPVKTLNFEDLIQFRKKAQADMNVRELSYAAVSEKSCGLAVGTEHIELLCCGGTGCKASSSAKIVENLKAAIEANGIASKVDVIVTGCFGFCEKGPIVKVMPDNTFYTQVKPEDADEKRVALRNCGFIDPENIAEYIARDGYMALSNALQNQTPEEVIDIIKKSGLRGRGGAGFPTGMKWGFARNYQAEHKYVVCNADEGDPGAFMDRSIMEGDPHSVIEAMALCGYCIGASEGLIYIRAEYPLAVHRLKVAIEQARDCGMLGKRIMGSDFDFDIEIRYGAGAFVCGEETALIHSMEGKRGEPTLKPPFPAESGYMGYPTNVNNVETLANVPIILTKGADWFASIGTEKSKGTKVFALAGKINNVGLIEVPMGTTLREIIYDIGGGVKNGKKFKAVQTGGPSGGCLTEKHLDIPIDYESLGAAGSMMGSGGMIVMDEDDCMVSVAKFYLEFTVGESCGKCTPCRIGNKRMLEILTRITEGKGTMDDIEHLKSLAATIKDTALCGLGQTSPNPVLSTIDNFYDEYVEHVKQHTCRAKQCKALLTYTVNPEKCKGCGACARNCPADAIMGDVRKPHVINPFKCIRCGMCQSRCRFDAIHVF